MLTARAAIFHQETRIESSFRVSSELSDLICTCKSASVMSLRGTLCTAASAEAISDDATQVTPCNKRRGVSALKWHFVSSNALG